MVASPGSFVFWVPVPFFFFLFLVCKLVQTRAVDHSARGSMKNAANCETKCELQDTNFVDSNALGGLGLHSQATSV
jgi:hypothetical protein